MFGNQTPQRNISTDPLQQPRMVKEPSSSHQSKKNKQKTLRFLFRPKWNRSCERENTGFLSNYRTPEKSQR
ncbi:hypothetical protein TNCV_2069961 [Trichonephila clavipes]|uniref:Uncharacterized protein n=1 Tax=Trichonephila clavipes TaxID=2585209 RepID=A0A8X7BD11_TRICX|nr:hypothetical protein TNCV_2069961 [Trichonephila clavipes]